MLSFIPITVEGCLYEKIKKAVDVTDAEVEKIKSLGAKGLENIKYPPETLHEIITNAVIHRDYGIADDVHVRLFDNRIEVQSPGRLPAHVTPKNILDERFARNGAIVRLLNKFSDPAWWRKISKEAFSRLAAVLLPARLRCAGAIFDRCSGERPSARARPPFFPPLARLEDFPAISSISPVATSTMNLASCAGSRGRFGGAIHRRANPVLRRKRRPVYPRSISQQTKPLRCQFEANAL